MNFLQAYLAAFKANYPMHDVKIKPRKVRGEIRYAVAINGDSGDLLLSEQDIRSATRMFNRGK